MRRRGLPPEHRRGARRSVCHSLRRSPCTNPLARPGAAKRSFPTPPVPGISSPGGGFSVRWSISARLTSAVKILFVDRVMFGVSATFCIRRSVTHLGNQESRADGATSACCRSPQAMSRPWTPSPTRFSLPPSVRRLAGRCRRGGHRMRLWRAVCGQATCSSTPPQVLPLTERSLTTTIRRRLQVMFPARKIGRQTLAPSARALKLSRIIPGAAQARHVRSSAGRMAAPGASCGSAAKGIGRAREWMGDFNERLCR